MADTVKLTIDGKEVVAKKGQTILEVVRQQKIADIPSLCYDPMLPPYGSCFLCVVEVEGFKKLLPSCATPVAEAMVIRTSTEEVKKSRKMALELLLSNHWADCVAPCELECPAGINIQGYIALASEGKYTSAVELIRQRNPLPLVCGRVCVRKCELSGCRRRYLDEAVGINDIKRYCADFELENHPAPPPPPTNGKKVAVVGGGPAGLSCGYYLRMMGYEVTIFEKFPKLGGMLRYGIPEYRLPRDVLDREIGFITTDIGIKIKTGVSLGQDFTFEELKSDGYSAVFLALGALGSKSMRVKGEHDTEGIMTGLDFLIRQELEGHGKLTGKVVVVGGGNTAVDVARTALRLGAREVTILYRRTRREMPADPTEVHDAETEGVKIEFLSAPVGIKKGENGKLAGLECIRMELGEPDESGRRRPIPIKGSEYFLPAEIVFSAIGQEPLLECVDRAGGQEIKKTKWKTIEADPETLQTSIDWIFAGGDVVTGPAVVIEAIAQGRKAALAIDRFIKEGKTEVEEARFLSKKENYGKFTDSYWEGFEKLPRQQVRQLDVKSRIRGFKEVSLGLTKDHLDAECSRCLECGCQVQLSCELRKYAEEYGVDITRFKGEHKRVRIDKRHPFIQIDNNKCILCARCIRTCAELIGVSALGLVHRGFRTEVHPAINKPLQNTTCVSCGNCAEACPTGALISKVDYIKKILPIETRKEKTVCNQCSIGCSIQIESVGNDIFWVSSPPLGEKGCVNRGYLCKEGRYNTGYIYEVEEGKEASLKPAVRENGQMKEASWDEAIKKAVEGLMKIRKKHGADAIGVFGSPSRTTEELYLLQKFARVVLGTNNVGSFSLMDRHLKWKAIQEVRATVRSNLKVDEILNADLILLVGTDVEEENFIGGVNIKWATKNGAKLITIGSETRSIDEWAKLSIYPKTGSWAVVLCSIASQLLSSGITQEPTLRKLKGWHNLKKLTKQAETKRAAKISSVSHVEIAEFARIIKEMKDKKVVGIYVAEDDGDPTGEALKALANLLCLIGKSHEQGSGIVIFEGFGNAHGAIHIGLTPELLPGYSEIAPTMSIDGKIAQIWSSGTKKSKLKLKLKGARTISELKRKVEAGQLKAAIVLCEDPMVNPELSKLLGTNNVFTVVADTNRTITSLNCDVFLPLKHFLEIEGTMINFEGRIQKLTATIDMNTRKDRDAKDGIEIIAKMNEAAGLPNQTTQLQNIWKEIKQLHPGFEEYQLDSLTCFLNDRWMKAEGRRFLNLKLISQFHPPPKHPYIVYQQWVEILRNKLSPI